MANLRETSSANIGYPPGSEYFFFDTTAASTVLGATPENSIGSISLTVEGTGWTGTIIPKGRGWGAAVNTMVFQSLGYQNRGTLVDTAAGTAITADGIYVFPMDGLEISIAVTVAAGSVKIQANRVRG